MAGQRGWLGWTHIQKSHPEAPEGDRLAASLGSTPSLTVRRFSRRPPEAQPPRRGERGVISEVSGGLSCFGSREMGLLRRLWRTTVKLWEVGRRSVGGGEGKRPPPPPRLLPLLLPSAYPPDRT